MKTFTQIKVLPGQTDRGLVVDVSLGTKDKRDRLLINLRAARGTRQLLAVLREQLETPGGRSRVAEIQPQIPRGLREDLRQQVGLRRGVSSNALVREALERLVDFDSGRRRLTRDGKTRWPRDSATFRERGRALVLDEDLTRFTFNAENSRNKRVVMRLVKSLGLTASQFFSALIERICTPGAERAQLRPGPNRGEQPLPPESPASAGGDVATDTATTALPNA